MNLKSLIFLAIMIVSGSGWAQNFDVIAQPDADDFLGPTASLPTLPIAPMAAFPTDKDILTDIFGQDATLFSSPQPVAATPAMVVPSQTITPRKGLYSPKHSVLTKLPDLPPPQLTVDPFVDTTREPVIQQADYADKALDSFKYGTGLYFTLPKEVRITFYEGQSDLSAQALKWVKAFALKVRQDPALVIELRVSEEDWPLQSQRAGLMIQVMLEQGLSRHQIQVIKSSRLPDTILMSYQNLADISGADSVKKGKKGQKTIRW